MIQLLVPELAESVTEGTIAQWLKIEGEEVEKGENVVELETDKVNIEIAAEARGTINKIFVAEGGTVKVGDVIASIDPTGNSEKKREEKGDQLNVEIEEKTPVFKEKGSQVNEVPSTNSVQEPIATPSARKLAREKGLNLKEIHARDPLGRIRKEDVMEYKENVKSEPSSKEKEEGNHSKQIERIPMSRRRQTIAKRLVEAQQTAAMLTTFNEIDMTNVMALRDRWKDKFFNDYGVKLGFMSFFTKAVIGALKKYPYVNAELNNNEIILKKFYDIGIAVSTEGGLVVPVVREANRLDFAQIEKEIGTLSEKAREKKLSMDDLQGGTFTITNGGVFGSLWSTPILNTPQVGILGMHKIQWRPVAINKEDYENRPMMYIALSYDHRIIDGRDAVGFLVKVKELIEDPEALLLQG